MSSYVTQESVLVNYPYLWNELNRDGLGLIVVLYFYLIFVVKQVFLKMIVAMAHKTLLTVTRWGVCS